MNAIPTPPSSSSRIHPLVAIAAIAVTLFSAIGIAAIVGWLPTGKANPNETTPAAASPSPLSSSIRDSAPSPSLTTEETTAKTAHQTASVAKASGKAAAATPVPKSAAAPVVAPTDGSLPVSLAAAPAPQSVTPMAPPPCPNCGTIENIREIKEKGEASGLGAIAGGVVGGLLGNQIGKGTGNTVATVLGAAGGAYAGHQIEKSQKTVSRYEITVRMSDGTLRHVYENAPPAWRIGDRVQLNNGALYSAY